jgi:hypothetical protein
VLTVLMGSSLLCSRPLDGRARGLVMVMLVVS